MNQTEKDKIIQEMRELQSITDRARNGDSVPCPHCGETLVYYGPDSGEVPGVFCPNKDFKALFNMKR